MKANFDTIDLAQMKEFPFASFEDKSQLSLDISDEMTIGWIMTTEIKPGN